MRKDKEIILGSKIRCFTVLKIDETKSIGPGKHHYYVCECNCGKQFSLRSTQINMDINNPNCLYIICNHLNKDKYIGKTFGNMKIISSDGFDDRYKRKRLKYLCKCLRCGKSNSRVIELIKKHNFHCNNIGCKPFGKESKKYKNGSDHISRGSADHKLWTKQILNNGNFKCIVCNINKKLKAHHLNGWHWCKNERFDLKNGVCICDFCHKSFHNKYGNSNNTKEQFQEFLEIYRLH